MAKKVKNPAGVPEQWKRYIITDVRDWDDKTGLPKIVDWYIDSKFPIPVSGMGGKGKRDMQSRGSQFVGGAIRSMTMAILATTLCAAGYAGYAVMVNGQTVAEAFNLFKEDVKKGAVENSAEAGLEAVTQNDTSSETNREEGSRDNQIASKSTADSQSIDRVDGGMDAVLDLSNSIGEKIASAFTKSQAEYEEDMREAQDADAGGQRDDNPDPPAPYSDQAQRAYDEMANRPQQEVFRQGEPYQPELPANRAVANNSERLSAMSIAMLESALAEVDLDNLFDTVQPFPMSPAQLR